MSTTTSKRPTAETVRDLFEDQIEREQRRSFKHGRIASDDNPYSTAPPIAIHDKHLVVRIAEEVGVTSATAAKYLDAIVDGNGGGGVDLVRVEVDSRTGEVERVMGISPHTLIAHLDTQRLHRSAQVNLSFDGFLLPPGEKADTFSTRHNRLGRTITYVTTLDAIGDAFRERSAEQYEQARVAREAEAAREADFDQTYPGLRAALTRICEGNDDELDAIRNGNHFYVAERKGEAQVAMTLTADGIARLAKALGL
jgi:hypothetical protein